MFLNEPATSVMKVSKMARKLRKVSLLLVIDENQNLRKACRALPTEKHWNSEGF